MGRKAISPLVAVVLLVGIAVVIAGLISSWITSFVDNSSKQDTCQISTMYTISDVTYNSSSGAIRMKVRNAGSTALYNFTVEADNGTDIWLAHATSPDPSYRVDTGRVQYISANANTSNITNVLTVTLLTESCMGYSPAPVGVENI